MSKAQKKNRRMIERLDIEEWRNRSFSRVWTLSDDTEIRGVEFTDGLLVVQLGKVVPEHHARKDFYLVLHRRG